MKKALYFLACIAFSVSQASGQASSTPADNKKKPLLIFSKPVSLSFYGDLGISNLSFTSGGENSKYSGAAWALGATLSIDTKKSSQVIHDFWSAGLGLRNLNSSSSVTDPSTGETIDDKYHMWYLEIPGSYTRINNKNIITNKSKIGYYWQAGLNLGLKMKVSESSGSETIDESSHSSALNISPALSGGISFMAADHTFLLGPYLSYSINNLSSESGVTVHAFSYGIKLMACPFK